MFGPQRGKKFVVFVDDLNMPAKEQFGAQPPLELIRQFMDHRGWYNRKENTFSEIVDTQFVAAMGPAGGGRTSVTTRLLRHFSLVIAPEFEGPTMSRIFGAILHWHLSRLPFDVAVRDLYNILVTSTLELFDSVRSTLLPTPVKSHYTFNLRDCARVIQGLCLCRPVSVRDTVAVVRLWLHESMRVFYDRLVDDHDRSWFLSEADRMITRHFGMDTRKLFGWDSVNIETARTIMFADFVRTNSVEPGVSAADARAYQSVPSHDALQRAVESNQDDLLDSGTGAQPLVIFRFAAEHVLRICRVLRLPSGHVMLVGVGGSGRRSVARLAAHIADCELFQIEIAKSFGRVEWRNEVKALLRKAATALRPTAFLFSDTQAKDEYMLEDINNLLNSGDVPNLFADDELLQVCESMRPLAERSGRLGDGSVQTLYGFFLARVRANLHVILCMSPAAKTFRTRLRMYPSLVNCCTIDWFAEWPEDALQAVAQRSLSEENLPPPLCDSAAKICLLVHRTTVAASAKFNQQERRTTHVTPTSYLELLSTFRQVLGLKRTNIQQLKQRYKNGLRKLLETSSVVAVMQRDLEDLKPQLIAAQKQTDLLLIDLQRESADVDAQRSVVAADEAAANEKAAKSRAIKDECESDLAEAIPVLKAAIAALDTLKPADISVVKTMKSPPEG